MGLGLRRHPDGSLVIRLDSGTAPNFTRARRDFGKAWEGLLPTLAGADFKAWRFHRDFKTISAKERLAH
jgi:hypothetical protein